MKVLKVPNVPFNAVVLGGLDFLKNNENFIVNVNCAEASTNGAKFQFDSFGELVCELRQIEVFHSWWAFCPTFFP
jgi:hypothetical protein